MLDRLLVADIGIDRVEDAQRRAGMGRDVQPRLGHQRQQTDRLERHGLAAGIRSGDHQHKGVRIQLEIDRHHRQLVEQRVPRLDQPDGGIDDFGFMILDF